MEANASMRLFLALTPGAAARAALAAHVQSWRWPAGATLYAPADWHLTLHFIGAVPRIRLAELRTAVRVGASPFVLSFGQTAMWPRGLAVLLPLTLPAPLHQLHEKLQARLLALDLHTESRTYTPHLTLARRSEGAVPPPCVPVWNWPVQSYALMESTGGTTPRYRIVQRYRLTAASHEAA